MADKEFEGKNLQEVLETASASLGIAEPDLDYEIVEQGRRGLFGVGAKSIRIRVMPPIDQLLGVPQRRRSGAPKRDPQKKDPQKRAPQGSAQSRRGHQNRPNRNRRAREESVPATPAPEGEVTAVGETVQKMVDLMGLDLTATAVASDSGVGVELSGPDTKLMLQKDRQLMSAVQFLLNRMARRTWPQTHRVQVSCEGQKRERDDELVERTRQAADQVLQTNQPERLPEMNAYERRLVHITVREFKGLGSRSEGNGHLKRVRIFKSTKS